MLSRSIVRRGVDCAKGTRQRKTGGAQYGHLRRPCRHCHRAGRGLGREYALAFASEGARVVVNDLGGTLAGSGNDSPVALAVADEIIAGCGNAVISSPE